jgi:hypothetical protein
MPRRLLALVVALALILSLSVLAVSPDGASAAPGEDNIAKFCQALLAQPETDPAFVRVSQGACVAAFGSDNPTPFLAGVCQTAAGRELAAVLTGQQVTNTGQCVLALRAFLATQEP